MLLELGGSTLGAQSVLRVSIEQALDELLAVVANYMLGEADLAIACSGSAVAAQRSDVKLTDQSVHLLGLLSVERRPAATHFKQEHAEGPEVDMLAVSLLVEQNLGRKISRPVSSRPSSDAVTDSVVPQKVLVSWSFDRSGLDSPKSHSATCPVASSKMFSGFRSLDLISIPSTTHRAQTHR